jgi:hypothetical protein
MGDCGIGVFEKTPIRLKSDLSSWSSIENTKTIAKEHKKLSDFAVPIPILANLLLEWIYPNQCFIQGRKFMNIFNTRSVSGVQEAQGSRVESYITVSSEVKATVSNRVSCETQNIEFDYNDTSVAFIARANTEDNTNSSKKGFQIVFKRDITSGSYSVPNQAFEDFYYFETGAKAGYTSSLQYKPQSGTVTVEVIENSEGKLHYTIGFDFEGKDAFENEVLEIVGEATLIVLMRQR